MSRKNLPGYLKHKASGQAVVVIHGKTIYLGKYKSKASRERYEEIISEYIANGRKLPPSQTQTGISCQELAVRFLKWAEGYYVKNGEQTATFDHCQRAVSQLIHHYGDESVDAFTPLSLDFLQKEWIEQGYARLTVNRYVCVIKQAFKHGVKFGWVDAQISYALQAVDNLKKGRTKAPEYREILPVDDEIIEKTLPFLPPIVADMVRVQRLAGMRPQDVRNLRFCDIDRTGDVWVYRPFTHKTEHKGKNRVVAIGPKAQAILAPYISEKKKKPEEFVFSPQDTVRDQRIARRRKRKTFNKQGEVQPSQRDRSNPNAVRKPGEKCTKDSYAQAIERACERAGVPHWTPNQLRHTAGTQTTANVSLEAAKEFLGHSSITTTEKFYVAPLPELAAEVARKFG